MLECFARYFGARPSTRPTTSSRTGPTERWSRGCYVGFTPPGVLLDYGPSCGSPSGRIHWAGTETSTIWNGYMDGAVRSGERAADEVNAGL